MGKARVAVVTFPGSNDDRDALHAVARLGGEGIPVWHGDRDLGGADAVILPGGFAYGDYLRTGAIASHAPVMAAVREHAATGRAVLGVCNGFQILCEAGLLPGALLRNATLSFICRFVHVRVESNATPFTREVEGGAILEIPIKHGEGQFVADPETLSRLEDEGRVVFRYCSPSGEIGQEFVPNGSTAGIAGVANEAGNVVGLMPHPEHATDPDVGPTGGRPLFDSLLSSLVPVGGLGG